MKKIITMCQKDIRGYTPHAVLSLMQEKIQEPHFIFELSGAYVLIGFKQKHARYVQVPVFNGHVENLAILQAVGQMYGIHLIDEIEPHLHSFLGELQNIDLSKPPIYAIKNQ